jgi:hypothetical protein
VIEPAQGMKETGQKARAGRSPARVGEGGARQEREQERGRKNPT